MSLVLGIIVGSVVTYVVAAYFYRRAARDLRQETERLRSENENLPNRIVQELVLQGVIPREREREARETVIQRLLRKGVQWTAPSPTVTNVTPGHVHGPEGPMGETFVQEPAQPESGTMWEIVKPKEEGERSEQR